MERAILIMHKSIILGGGRLRFLQFNHMATCQAWVDKRFPDYISLNYQHAGRLSHQIEDGELRHFAQPVAWWTWPGPRFTYGNQTAPGWDHYFVCFDGPLVLEWSKSGLLRFGDPHGWRKPTNPEAFREKFAHLLDYLSQSAPERAFLLLQNLLLDLVEGSVEDAPSDAHTRQLNQLAARLRTLPANPWDETREAAAMAVSPVHLRRLFRAAYGLPPHRYWMRRRLDAARELLRQTSLPLKEIAQRCGFYDEYHFSRKFKSAQGVPPGEFRRQSQLQS